MTNGEDNQKPADERRSDQRVTYTAILGFKELNGQKIPPNSPKPNAMAKDLSLGGICFQTKKRPKSELLILYLPDGSCAVSRVVNITQDVDSLTFSSHCKVVRWLPDSVTTIELPNSEPMNSPVTQGDQ